MSSTLELLRPEISRLKPYKPAEYVGGFIRLNANETPWRPPGDESRAGLNRYPDPRPAELTAKLAAHYGVPVDGLLVTRGSSEAIDLLIRSFCRAGQDEIIICPPTFGMYEFYAQIQGAGIRRIPLDRENSYALPVAEICTQWTEHSKLVFVCSPNNPTGNCFPNSDIDRLATALAGRGVVVVDAAYVEFAATDPMHELLARHDNIVVLRTLSKSLSLAGIRCGSLIGHTPLIELIGRTLPPYCFPTASQDAVLRCLSTEAQTELATRRAIIIGERKRLAEALAELPDVRRIWPSEANFLLVETTPDSTLSARARAGNILLRDFGWDPVLPNCVRITVGSPADNEQLLKALRS
jgi:histidinol-phosphate aminotransferase